MLKNWFRPRTRDGLGRHGRSSGAACGTPARGIPAAVESLEDRRLFAAGTTRLWIEAGSTTTYVDSSKRTWGADRGFSGGGISSSAFAVANTTDDRLYYTRRAGVFTYSLPATNGDYTLRLLFADPTYTTAGKRKFHVRAEGQQVLTNFDIAADGGGKRAISRSVPVTITDGRLDLAFAKGLVGHPIVSAIELLPAGVPATVPAAPTGLTAAVGSAARVDLRWNDVSDNENSFRIERSVAGGAFAFLADVPANVVSFADTQVSAGVTYGYRVRAVNAVGPSAPSNVASASVPAAPSTGWANGPTAPVARVEASGIQVGSKLYIWGGFTGTGGYAVHSRMDVLDLATQTWSTRGPSPAPETHAAVATDGQYIYAAGGQYGGGLPGTPSADVWRYDTVTDTWSSAVLPDLPEARYGGGMSLLDNKLYFFGGNRPDRTTVASDLWVLDIAYPMAGWTTKASLPADLSGDHISTATVNGKVYAVGGEHGHAHDETDKAPYIQHAYLMEYDPLADTWTRKADLPQASSHMESATLVVNGMILALGGQIDDLKTTPAVRAYDPAANAWTSLAPLPERRKGGVAGFYDGKAFYTGGQRDGDNLVSTTTWVGTLSGFK
jgi:N-acetylneuraminic acid mutarotase